MKKRITLFAGHYGSGKTSLALNYARELRNAFHGRVAIADLDIVNPYFRTKDFAERLTEEGIELVVSEYANSNVDFPALPAKAYSLFADRDLRVVVDVGGDDRGALALGRYVDDLKKEDDYEMIGVINASRPLTSTPEDTVNVLREIEQACSLKITALANNTNLGAETDEKVIADSLLYAEEVSKTMRVPVLMTTCPRQIERRLRGKVQNLFPVDILPLYYHLQS